VKKLIRKILKEEIDSDWDFIGDVRGDMQEDLSVESITYLIHNLGNDCFYIDFDDGDGKYYGQIKFNGTMDTFDFINKDGVISTIPIKQLYHALTDKTNTHMTYEIGKCRG